MAVNIDQWNSEFCRTTFLSEPYKIQLQEVFGNLDDLTDSALKMIVPMILAYSNLDAEAEKLVMVNIVDGRLKITMNIPIAELDIQFGNRGRLTTRGFLFDDVNQP